MEYGKMPGLCRFCGTGFEQVCAASIMTSVKCLADCSVIGVVGILVGIFRLDCIRLENLFQSSLPLINECLYDRKEKVN